MGIANAIILAVVQGLTEFLPVSSSGHLVIFRELLHAEEALLTFDIVVHLGTLVAVFLVFRNDVKALISAAVGTVVDMFRGDGIKTALAKDNYRKVVILIIVASIPAAIMGIVFQKFVYSLFSSTLAVGIFLVATGTVLWLGEFFSESRFTLFDLTWLKALCIGIAQGFAIVPGFSRSGATISTGLLLGLDREEAARFSFLMSIPVILGAGVLELKDLTASQLNLDVSAPFVVGFVASILSGYLAIRLVLTAIKRRKLTVFSVYTWILGIIVIIGSLI